MLKASSLSLQIGPAKILDRIDLDIPEGCHMVILGPNGAGKSSLLRALSGELEQYQGEIHLNGKELGRYPAGELARTRSIMPQEVQLAFPFKAWEVVDMGNAPHPKSHKNRSIAMLCMQLFEVQDLKDRLYPTLSGGEKQRVQLARVLCQLWKRSEECGPRYLFLDECTSALDASHQHKVFELVKRLAGQEVTSVSIMHDLNLASQYADHIVLMQQGRIVTQGRPDQVLTEHCLKQVYQIENHVIPHPSAEYPLIVSCGSLGSSEEVVSASV